MVQRNYNLARTLSQFEIAERKDSKDITLEELTSILLNEQENLFEEVILIEFETFLKRKWKWRKIQTLSKIIEICDLFLDKLKEMKGDLSSPVQKHQTNKIGILVKIDITSYKQKKIITSDIEFYSNLKKVFENIKKYLESN